MENSYERLIAKIETPFYKLNKNLNHSSSEQKQSRLLTISWK